MAHVHPQFSQTCENCIFPARLWLFSASTLTYISMISMIGCTRPGHVSFCAAAPWWRWHWMQSNGCKPAGSSRRQLNWLVSFISKMSSRKLQHLCPLEHPPPISWTPNPLLNYIFDLHRHHMTRSTGAALGSFLDLMDSWFTCPTGFRHHPESISVKFCRPDKQCHHVRADCRDSYCQLYVPTVNGTVCPVCPIAAFLYSSSLSFSPTVSLYLSLSTCLTRQFFQHISLLLLKHRAKSHLNYFNEYTDLQWHDWSEK